MKRMKRIAFALGLAALMALAGTSMVFAGEVKGSVDYDGNYVNVNYKAADFKEALTTMVPGDSVTLKIDMENKSADATDWYVENKVIKTFEEGAKASGGAYSYSLSYTDPSGNVKEIYSSDRVGGEGADGLKTATSGMEEYFYIAQLDAGQKGTLSARVSIEGETVTNAYQSSLADVNVNFAVEKATAKATDSTGTTSTTSSNSSSSSTETKHLTKTGDDMKLLVLIILFAVAATGMIVLLVIRRKMKGGSDEESV